MLSGLLICRSVAMTFDRLLGCWLLYSSLAWWDGGLFGWWVRLCFRLFGELFGWLVNEFCV